MQGSENIQEAEAKGKVLESVVTERDLGVFVICLTTSHGANKCLSSRVAQISC